MRESNKKPNKTYTIQITDEQIKLIRMKDIKCKAWDETHKEWINYGFCLRFDADGNCEVLNVFAQPFTDRKVIPVLWTGLKDKNKKDVYAGDIIQIMNPFSEKILASVVWDVARPMYHWMIGETWMLHFIDGIAKDENTPLYPYCQSRSGFDVTVVGNIHEHVHLLEKQ